MIYKYRLAIFDLDGTLLDTSKGIISCVNHVVKSNNMRNLTDNELLSFIGPPIQNSFKKSFELDNVDCQRLAEEFRDIYKETFLFEAEPYAGIYELLDLLKKDGVEIAVATYKREDYAIKLLNHFGFDAYSSNMHGADNFNVLKKKDIINICIDNSVIKDLNEIVYIGDTESDINAAKETGVSFIGVNYGFGFKSVEEYVNKPIDIEYLMRSTK